MNHENKKLLLYDTPRLTAHLDEDTRALWVDWHESPRACVTQDLLNDLLEVHDYIRVGYGTYDIDFYVQYSRVPDIFNLGGDLNLFKECILNKDVERLTNYAQACIAVISGPLYGFERDVISISMIQGKALGGGIEAALAMDYIVAEDDTSSIGFPEVIFNLFPGMGAYNILANKIGDVRATALLTSGKVYKPSYTEVSDLIHVLCRGGGGYSTTENLILDLRKHLAGIKAIHHARRMNKAYPTRGELIKVVHYWVDCAMKLKEKDLKLIGKLVASQTGSSLITA